MGIDFWKIENDISYMNEEKAIMEKEVTIDSRYLSKVLVELAEEDLKCPDNRRYVSMSGVIKVKSKVQTQY